MMGGMDAVRVRGARGGSEMPGGGDDGAVVLLVVVGLAALAIYLLPSIVAFSRGHPNRWVILVINVAAGVTVLGWLLTLAWSAQAIHRSPLTARGEGSHGGESGLNLFANDVRRVRVEHMPGNVADELWKLQTLRERGAISAAEFEHLKRKLIG